MIPVQRILALLWRGVVVGVAYVAAMMLAGIVFGLLGLVPAAGGNAAASLFWILMAGILLGLYLGPLAARTTATRRQHVLIWTAVIFFNMGAVMLEGAYFAPDLVPIPVPLLAVQQFLAAVVAGSLIALLFARPGQTAAFGQTLSRRPWPGWLWRFLLASASYLIERKTQDEVHCHCKYKAGFCRVLETQPRSRCRCFVVAARRGALSLATLVVGTSVWGRMAYFALYAVVG